MPMAGFEPATRASKRPLTHTLNRAATRICKLRTSLDVVRMTPGHANTETTLHNPFSTLLIGLVYGYIVASFSYLTTMEVAYAV
jgi:hypothetical protein